MKALRLPIRVSAVAYLVRSRSPRVPASFVSRRSAALPEDRRSLPGQGLLLVPATLAPAPCAWTRMGSLRSSGDPSCASAAFQDPGRTDVSSPLSVTSMLPPLSERRGLRHCRISGLTRSFSTCCHTLHARRCRRRARLASGWLAFTGRESNPLDRYERFQFVYRSSSFPALLTLSDCRHGPSSAPEHAS